MKDNEDLKTCPLRAALAALGGKWNLIIIKTIGTNELRFNQIKKGTPDISEKILIEKLKVLKNFDLVIRKNFQEIPPKVSYRLSKEGLKALKIVDEIESFGSNLTKQL